MLRRGLAAFVLTALLTLAAGTAHADPPPARAMDAGRWYGWQVLLADGAVLAATGLCLDWDLEEGCWYPASGYLLTGPTIHALHRGPLRALASVALRLTLPFLGMWLGNESAADDCAIDSQDGNCGIGASLVGFGFGVAAAIAIEAIWAFDDVKVAGQSPPAARGGALSVMPTMSLTLGGAGIGLAGRF